FESADAPHRGERHVRSDKLLNLGALLSEATETFLRRIVVLALRVPGIANDARAAAVERVVRRLAGHLEPCGPHGLRPVALRVVNVLERDLDTVRDGSTNLVGETSRRRLMGRRDLLGEPGRK